MRVSGYFTQKLPPDTEYSLDMTVSLYLLLFDVCLLTGYRYCITFVVSDFE